MIGYHFTNTALRDGRPIPPIGEWLEHDGPIVRCESGLYASEHPFDALQYAPGPILHRVELEGDLAAHGYPVDKWVGQRRRILATIDATELLREFARWCALQVIHLWDAPPVVREYLETGDESKRSAAGAAAYDAAAAAANVDVDVESAANAAADAAGSDAWDAAADAAWDAWDATDAGDAHTRKRFAEMVEAAFRENP